jgi:hypothetical protein
MNKNLSQLFKQAYNHPESRLSDDIWRAIQAKEARSLKIQSLFYGFIGILSLGGFVFIAVSLKKQFSSSGFFEYVSLIFSDSGLIALYWKEYLLSLADSLPIASLGSLLFLLGGALISIRKAVYQYRSKLLVAKL